MFYLEMQFMLIVVEVFLLNKKAQFSSIDFIMALFVFMIIIVALFYSYDSFGRKLSSDELTQDATLIFTYATQSLMSTPGSPINWNLLSDFNTTSVHALGLATKPGILSEDKLIFLTQLSESNYTKVKTILGVLGPGYEFGYDLFYYNGTNYNLANSFGEFNMSAKNVLVSQRNFILDNSSKTFGYMRFYLTK